MTTKELKQKGVKIEKIDNGYNVPKTLKLTMENTKCIIEIDKDDYFGLKSYVMSVNGKDLINEKGKSCRWENLENAKADALKLFNNEQQSNYFTYA